MSVAALLPLTLHLSQHFQDQINGLGSPDTVGLQQGGPLRPASVRETAGVCGRRHPAVFNEQSRCGGPWWAGLPPPHWAACPGEACAEKVGVEGPRGRSATPPQPPPPAAASRLPVRGCSAPRGGDAEGGRGGRAQRGAHSTLLRARLEPQLPAALGGQRHV